MAIETAVVLTPRRSVALPGIVIVPLIAGYRVYEANVPPSTFNIAVAGFDNGSLPDPDDYEVQRLVHEELVVNTAKYPNIRVINSNQIPQTNFDARTVGRRYKSAIVIWGSYRVAQQAVLLSVNFEITCPLKCPIDLSDDVKGKSQEVKRSKIEEFSLQRDLSYKMSFLRLSS